MNINDTDIRSWSLILINLLECRCHEMRGRVASPSRRSRAPSSPCNSRHKNMNFDIYRLRRHYLLFAYSLMLSKLVGRAARCLRQFTTSGPTSRLDSPVRLPSLARRIRHSRVSRVAARRARRGLGLAVHGFLLFLNDSLLCCLLELFRRARFAAPFVSRSGSYA